VCVTEMINATTQFVLNVRPTQYWVNNLNSRAYSTYYRNLKRQKKKKLKMLACTNMVKGRLAMT